jgi:hypothetical protein
VQAPLWSLHSQADRQADVVICSPRTDRQADWCDAQLKEAVDDARVRDLVARLVCGDGAADLAEHVVAVAERVPRGAAVRDLGRALLEDGQTETCTHAHARPVTKAKCTRARPPPLPVEALAGMLADGWTDIPTCTCTEPAAHRQGPIHL